MTEMTQAHQGNWLPGNYARIQAALAALPPPAERDLALAAVFDFDNTCVFRDIGQALFRVQMLELRYRICPDTLAALIPEDGVVLAGRPWPLLREALLSCYRGLWPLIQAGRYAEAKAAPAYGPFVALLAWLVSNARKAPHLGPRYVLSLLAKLQAGHRLDELRAFGLQVLRQLVAEPLATLSLEACLPEPLGHISVTLPTGLRPFAEMRDLMGFLQTHGLQCHVVSASSEWLVQTVAPVLGFPLRAEGIFGVRTAIDANGMLLPENAADYPLTFRDGKNVVIDRFIRARPWLVAGDADTDYDMLTRPEPAIRLLINRRQSGLIASLYPRPDILLQGIDQSAGCFRPSSETVD